MASHQLDGDDELRSFSAPHPPWEMSAIRAQRVFDSNMQQEAKVKNSSKWGRLVTAGYYVKAKSRTARNVVEPIRERCLTSKGCTEPWWMTCGCHRHFHFSCGVFHRCLLAVIWAPFEDQDVWCKQKRIRARMTGERFVLSLNTVWGWTWSRTLRVCCFNGAEADKKFFQSPLKMAKRERLNPTVFGVFFMPEQKILLKLPLERRATTWVSLTWKRKTSSFIWLRLRLRYSQTYSGHTLLFTQGKWVLWN